MPRNFYAVHNGRKKILIGLLNREKEELFRQDSITSSSKDREVYQLQLTCYFASELSFRQGRRISRDVEHHKVDVPKSFSCCLLSAIFGIQKVY